MPLAVFLCVGHCALLLVSSLLSDVATHLHSVVDAGPLSLFYKVSGLDLLTVAESRAERKTTAVVFFLASDTLATKRSFDEFGGFHPF